MKPLTCFAVFLLLLPGPILAADAPLPSGHTPGLLQQMLDDGRLDGIKEVIFSERGGTGWHWYETFGYVCQQPQNSIAPRGGSKLQALNLRTGEVRTILEDDQAAIRDPVVHWSGNRILFSWLKGPANNFLLYEIGADGTNLRQITTGKFDDIEPVYLPDDSIMFGSGRAKRWVPCFRTQVATIHKCDADGANVRMISTNVEHDNTPWVMNDGRVLYTRWEYVMRGVMSFHHLWTMNPDGTSQMVYFGNHFDGTLMIDAKHIPDSEKIVSIFSPWHGGPEHNGAVAILDASHGSDQKEGTVKVLQPQGIEWEPTKAWKEEFQKRDLPQQGEWRDPYAISEDCLFVAFRGNLCLMDGEGNFEILYTIPGMSPENTRMHLHEPRPLIARERPPVIADRTDLSTDKAQFYLQDIYVGRQMEDVKRGSIKKLVIVEELPNPVSFGATTEPQIGQHNLERVIGEVPVEPDGSAFFEAPAGRSLVFLAMNENDECVKPMRSFTTAMPGEVQSCVGCHEHRTQAPPQGDSLTSLALMRGPDQVTDITEVLHDIIDFQRDIQPILDRHCVECHDASGDQKMVLSGDAGSIASISYRNLRHRRHGLVNLGSSKGRIPAYEGPSMASKIVGYFEGDHHDAKATENELRLLKLWLDTGACYAGTYAAVGSGVLGGHIDLAIPTPPELLAQEIAYLEKNCQSCHEPWQPRSKLKGRDLERRGFPFRILDDVVTNLTRPELSRVLRAPLAKDAGGLGLCKSRDAAPDTTESGGVFQNKDDPRYQELREIVLSFPELLHNNGSRFYMPDFQPNPHYIREMKRYGVLPEDFDPAVDDADWYAVDDTYYRLFWPKAAEGRTIPLSRHP